MKGVTSVVSSILLLLIALTMVGLAVVWFYGVEGDITGNIDEDLKNKEIWQRQKIDIIDPTSTGIDIMNVGTYNIKVSEVHLFINDVLIDVRPNGDASGDCQWDSSITSTDSEFAPSGIITADCSCDPVAKDKIKVVAPGNTDLAICK